MANGSLVRLMRVGLALGAGCAATKQARLQGFEEYEQAPIRYSATQARDRAARLEERIARGEVRLEGAETEVVRRLLSELEVPVDSQILVFSKTSLQRGRISPETPRALYFSDDCYVGWVPGGLVEIAGVDAELGPVFYAFDPRASGSPGSPELVRDPDCLSCHGGLFVREIPALFARSVFTDEEGEPLLRRGSELVDYRTPFTERWGGWYVSGTHGSMWHRGNVVVRHGMTDLEIEAGLGSGAGANLTSLDRFFDTDQYLAESSDLVALMVFEHQIAMQNAITRAAFKCRRMLDYQRNLQRELGQPESDAPEFSSVKRVFENRARDVVDHLLFKDEAPFPPGGVTGVSGFMRSFAQRGPRARNGASLRDLRLTDRLFENRCSYLIYSDSFRAMPAPLKRLVCAELARALDPAGPDPRYAYLGAEERLRIAAILRETHSELPPGWLETTL